jgi:hypothetical protein
MSDDFRSTTISSIAYSDLSRSVNRPLLASEVACTDNYDRILANNLSPASGLELSVCFKTPSPTAGWISGLFKWNRGTLML